MKPNRDRNKKKEGQKRKEYKGPFPFNKNYEVETTRKYMKTNAEDPTVDEFSYQDTTDSIDISDSSPQKQPNKRPRKKQSLIHNWIKRHSSEIIVSIIAVILTSFFGVVVYNHSNHLVAHDKDIEYIKEKESDLKEDIQSVEYTIDNVKDKVHEIDKKIDIHDLQINKKQNNNKK